MSSIVWIVLAVIVILIIAGALLLAARRRPRLRALPDESRARHADRWRAIEVRFVDDPRAAIREADALAVAVLRERGADVDGRGAEAQNLEQARRLARPGSDGAGLSETESLRRAMVAYQRIVDEAVGESTRRAYEARRPEVN